MGASRLSAMVKMDNFNELKVIEFCNEKNRFATLMLFDQTRF
jgi:hypothetical protein